MLRLKHKKLNIAAVNLFFPNVVSKATRIEQQNNISKSIIFKRAIVFNKNWNWKRLKLSKSNFLNQFLENFKLLRHTPKIAQTFQNNLEQF